jgi:hypothetical protein
VRPQITSQFGYLLKVVAGVVWVVTDCQPNATKRDIDIIVADWLRPVPEIDPGLEVGCVGWRSGAHLFVLICLMLKPGLSSVMVMRFIVPSDRPSDRCGSEATYSSTAAARRRRPL